MNKLNIIEKANNMIESLEIESNKSAAKYLDYAKENGIKTSDKNSIGRKILQCHLMKYGVSNIWYKAAEKHGVNTKEELYQVYFNQLVDMLRAEKEVEEIEPIKEEFYSNNKEIEPAAEETEQEQQIRENNNYITLTEEQKKERIELINLWNTKAPGDKEQGKERFLQLLFEYQEQKKTKEEFKSHINKLYAANKNIKSCYTGKKDFNNYLTDLLATENILQKNDIIKNEFFNNAYNYIKSC